MKKYKTIQIAKTDSNFEREPLIRPFGFKGAYLTELWQIITRLTSTSGITCIGLSTQSVLYGDADLFVKNTEAAGNTLMYALTNKALELVKERPFNNPIELVEAMLPKLLLAGKQLTNKSDLHINFSLNSLVSVDHAAWLLYAAENNISTFRELIPEDYKTALSAQNDKLAVMFQIPYGMPLEDIKSAAQQGYFVFKIKTGFPGNQETMLKNDVDRLTQIHDALKDVRTPYTSNGKILYTMDANGRYERKETLLRYLQHAEKIGALTQILFYEEPFPERNDELVSDIEIRIAGDESIYDEKSALKRLEQGYQAIVLKGIAKTLSLSMKIAKLARERNIPCSCSDLTVNPILIDWHKNLACSVAPFPGINMGLIETNGDMNYLNWDQLCSYHPANKAVWTNINEGTFHLNQDFHMRSGGIFEMSKHYEEVLSN
ncbi:mandelate racemase/muconate lactonizing enzyme family protein [Olivibacter domesticus]|uniref:L-alanine-DL-glutamate epimerase n=1 Tax=Olivibacter domesticus TaxID=407022 RepID=A0A1H7QH89_OLID1|nr:mandelate racemase/muconate lactonizing enzyme family protein [Olivibacter domesticus]SEL47306.1 L-alanine-DL-glutamate epimerase [Olivibacter domesticus]